MTFHGIKINQSDNVYQMINNQGIEVAYVSMPKDKQYTKDALTLESISKYVAARWNPNKPKRKDTDKLIQKSNGGIVYVQINISAYAVNYLVPESNRWYTMMLVRFPPDRDYISDAIVLIYICHALAKRYKLIE